VEQNKSSEKKIRQALGLLQSIQAQKEPTLESMIKFQDQYRSIPAEEHPWFFEAVIRKFEISKKISKKNYTWCWPMKGKTQPTGNGS